MEDDSEIAKFRSFPIFSSKLSHRFYTSKKFYISNLTSSKNASKTDFEQRKEKIYCLQWYYDYMPVLIARQYLLHRPTDNGDSFDS